MDTIRDVEKYVYNIFSNRFNLPPYFDAHIDLEQEKTFRQMIDIEYYLQQEMKINNLLLFSRRSFYSRLGHFQIDFDNGNIKVSMSSQGILEPFCINSVRFIMESRQFGKISYLSHSRDAKKLSLFPAYCLLKKFFTGDNLYDIEYDIKKGIEACHEHLGKNKIEAVSKKNLAASFEIHLLKQHANEKSYMILGYGLQDKLCRQHRTLLMKNGDPVKKVVIITDCLDIFIDQKNIQKDITYISWDHPHVEIEKLNWNILKGCHVFYILTEHSGRQIEEVYKTSTKVKKELYKVNIKSFRYIFLERHRNSDGQLTRVRPIPYIYSFEEFNFLKNPPAPPVMSLKQHKAQLTESQETLLHPYLKTGTATLIYGNPEVNKTVFTLTLAHAMRLGQCAFKGWREGEEPSLGAYFFNNYGDNQTSVYFKNVKNVTEKIFVKRNKYKKMPPGYIYPPGFKIILENYDSLTNKADFIKKNIQDFSSGRFIILENAYSDPKLLPEQNILVRELTDCGWCVIIVASLNSMHKKLFLNKMTTVDNVIKLSPQRPSVFGNTKLKVEIRSSTIVPAKERKNITCEFNLHSKRPTCNQISSKKRRKFTREEREGLKNEIKALVDCGEVMPNKDIAAALGITESMVKKLLGELKLRKYNGRFIIKVDHQYLS